MSVVLHSLTLTCWPTRAARGTSPRACLRLELLGQACDECARGAAGDEVQEGLVK